MRDISSFMKSTVAALGALTIGLLGDKAKYDARLRAQQGPGRKVNRRPAGTLSQVHAGGVKSRQVLRAEARAQDKALYRYNREETRRARKQASAT